MIKVHANIGGALGALAAAAGQMPYAVSLALNRAANAAQKAEQAHIKQAFKLRREQFVLRGVKIAKADRATKTSWRVTIQLAYPDQRPFLDQHEPGGERVRHGGGRLWQPNPAEFKSKIIGRANPLHPKALGLHRDQSGRIVGEQRTFLVRSKGQVLILQREGRRLDKRSSRLSTFTLDNVATGMGPRMKKQKALRRTGGTRLLYRLVERVKIPARLEFVPTISRTAEQAWPAAMQQALVDALRGSR